MLIVVQGDHGSRIWLHNPIAANKDSLLPSDYANSFSTLFAVKAPGVEAAYDTRTVAIQDLLSVVASTPPLDQLPASENERYILLETQPRVVFEDALTWCGNRCLISAIRRGKGSRSDCRSHEGGGRRTAEASKR